MAVDFGYEENPRANPKNKKVNSNTPILDNFSRDLIKLAEEGKIDPIVGRDKEVKRTRETK
jgi:ATP-dependent Clp protease ATP-binding subunit ClpC